MRPPLNKTCPGLIYAAGGEPKPAKISLKQDGSLEVTCDVAAPLAHVFVKTEKGKYGLGVWSILEGRGQRAAAASISPFLLALEPTALTRLSALLQRAEGLLSTISLRGNTYAGRSVPVKQSGSSRLFLFGSQQSIPGSLCQAGTVADVTVTIQGMEFCFSTPVLDFEETLIAFSLPASGQRQLRRAVARKDSVGFSVRIGVERHEARVIDFSPLGMRLEVSARTALSVWQELELTFDRDGEEISAVGLVLNVDGATAHLILAGGTEGHKRLFYALWNRFNPGIRFFEDATQAWQALLDFGYLDLLDGGPLKQTEADCISAWEATMHSNSLLQTVAEVEKKTYGTIGVAQVAPDHWMPHAFAAKVDPSSIAVTEALYLSWPIYLLSQGEPLWFSTWYNANKPWHNRFYQVFLSERAADPDCFSIVRKLYWTNKIPSTALNERLQIVPITRDRNLQQFLSSWGERYGQHSQRMPLARLASSKHFIFSEEVASVDFLGKSVGLAKVIKTERRINPLSVFNIFHLNLFDNDTRRSEPRVREIVSSVCRYLSDAGFTSAALTTDFDIPVQWLDGTPFVSLGDARCLSAHSDLLPSLISNNVLSFAEMRSRLATK